jgi:hypothetical protein
MNGLPASSKQVPRVNDMGKAEGWRIPSQVISSLLPSNLDLILS